MDTDVMQVATSVSAGQRRDVFGTPQQEMAIFVIGLALVAVLVALLRRGMGRDHDPARLRSRAAARLLSGEGGSCRSMSTADETP